jgi:elongation factor G
LRVLDGAVCVLDSNQGVEPQTETVWRQGDKYNVPRIVFCNKMDKTGASFQQCLDDIKERLGARPVPIQLPIGAEAEFKGVVDLVRMKAVIWENEALGANYHDEDIPADMLDAAKQARAEMIEACAELDEQATEDFLNGKEIPNETIKKLLRKAVLTAAFFRSYVAQPSRTRAFSRSLMRSATIFLRHLTALPLKALMSKPAEKPPVLLQTLNRLLCWRSS